MLLQVGRAFVTPTDGQVYAPIDGAVTVPIAGPDDPKVGGCVIGAPTGREVPDCIVETWCLTCLDFFASAAKGIASPATTNTAIASLVVIMACPFLSLR